MKKIEFTSDWILSNLSHTYQCVKGNAIICTSHEFYPFIKLTLDTIGVNYEFDFYGDNDDDVLFEFGLSAIRKDCPTIYKELEQINKANDNNYLNVESSVNHKIMKNRKQKLEGMLKIIESAWSELTDITGNEDFDASSNEEDDIDFNEYHKVIKQISDGSELLERASVKIDELLKNES
jgi:hypothetical protein